MTSGTDSRPPARRADHRRGRERAALAGPGRLGATRVLSFAASTTQNAAVSCLGPAHPHFRARALPPYARRAPTRGLRSLAAALGVLLAGVLALALAPACSGGARAHPNVVIVLVDTLRADRLDSFGGARGLTPFVDAWAAGARTFQAAFAHAPWTLPSTASLLTSTYPQQHGAGGVVPHRDASGAIRGGFTGLAEGLPTLAERFAAAGYRTGCVVNVDFLARKFGLTRGFEWVDEVYYADNEQVRDATATTDAALAWLDARDARSSFLLVHYFDAHAVYAPPRDFRREHAFPEDREDESFRFPTREQMVLLRAGQLELDPRTVRRAEALYDGEVAYVDSQIGRLLDGLRTREMLEDTIVVLTADHGEEFFDHKGFEHGHTLYDELLRVPLAIGWEGRIPPGASESIVGLIDVAPTLCELAGVAPAPTFVGTSLVEDWRGGAAAPTSRALIAHGNFWGPPLSSLRQDALKLILGPAAPSGARAHVLYDWRLDPRETIDRSRTHAEQVTTLRQRLEETERALEHRRGSAVELDDATFERLKEHGYVGGDESEDEGGD